MKRKNNYSLIHTNLHSPTEKKGASPGAIMNDEQNNRIMVKLSLPPAQEKFKISDLEQINNFIASLSRAACYEQLFFNLAERICGDKLEVPETFLTMLMPAEYDRVAGKINLRNVSHCLRKKFSIDNFELNSEIIIECLKNSKIPHICSVMIDGYRDLKDCYPEVLISPEDDKKLDLPPGIGAFFAFNACMGNNDCIGSSGTNAGFLQKNGQIILVDGGNYRFNPERINRTISVADNNGLMLSFDTDLDSEEKKQACEVFIRFASLDERELRSLITEDEKYINCNFLSEKDVKTKVNEIKLQQRRVVEVFYEDMLKYDLEIPMKINDMARKIQIDNSLNSIALEFGSKKFSASNHYYPIELVDESSSVEGISNNSSPMAIDNKENIATNLNLNSPEPSSLLNRRKNKSPGFIKLEILPAEGVEQSKTPKIFNTKNHLKNER